MSKYLIGGGYYSDWYTVGYADDEETAKKIVYQKNLNRDGTIGDEYWYRKLDRIEVVGDIDTSGVYIKYTYTEYHGADGDSNKLDFGEDELYGSNLKTEPMTDKFNSSSFKNGYGWVAVTFTTPFNTSRDKVLKIGRDKLAMYKAKKMGLV